ncbi:MAG: ATP-binding protein [Bacteroidota bacterium]
MKLKILTSLGVILTFFSLTFTNAQEFSGHHIKKLTQKDGLSSAKVNVIFKGSQDFIWLGTDNGLNRYDGKNIKIFSLPKSSKKLSGSPYIKSIVETADQRLWIGTTKGLFLYNREQEELILTQSQDLSVLCLAEDRKGNLIVGTIQGLFVIPNGENETVDFWSYFQLEQDEAVANIGSIYVDEKDLIWLGMWGTGLCIIDRDKKTITNRTVLKDEEGNSQIINNILAIASGPDGSIWAGGYDFGLVRIDPDGEQFSYYKHNPNDPNSLNNHQIKSLSFDRRGYLWIGLEEGGLDRFAPEDEVFEHYLAGFKGDGMQEGYSVYSTYIDNQDQIWIGLRNDGLQVAPLFPSLFENFVFEEDGYKEEFAVLSMWEEEEYIWTGIRGALRKMNKNNRAFQNFTLPEHASPLGINTYDQDHLIIGTITGEIYLFNKTTESFSPFLDEELLAKFEETKINSFYPYSTNKLFIGAKKGTYLYDQEANTLKLVAKTWTHTFLSGPEGSLWFINFGTAQYQYFPETGKLITYEPESIGNTKAAIYLNNKLYLGSDFGLFEYDMLTNTTKEFTDIFPYINNQVNAMLLDDSKNIWFSSVDGIIRMNTEDNSFRSFDNFDGVPDIRFRDEVAVKLSDGKLAFGGNGGFTILSPDDYRNNMPDMQLEFTDVMINGNAATKELLADEGQKGKEDLRLKRSQRNLSIEFSLLSYTNPDKHRYQYRLTGGNEGWIDLGNTNKVELINIPTGKHALHVRAANENGNWTEEKVLNIRVLPALLLRWYFILLYLVVIGVLILVAFRVRSNQLYMEKEFAIEHLKMENIREKAEREAEFHNMRLMFFTNISHEFRTPLTLILAPLEKFIQKGIEPGTEHLKLMYKNAERLRRLIGQILDFRKMEAGELKFEPSFGDIFKFTKDCWHLFEPLAQKKDISFEFHGEETTRLLWFDKDKYEKIIINLLSNAFKFTEKGRISLSLVCEAADESHTDVQIVVSDTGSGILEQDLPHIFDRFYNTKSSVSGHYNGTGIGLSLVKELILMHKGTIVVESEQGKGTTFKIQLLLENQHKVAATSKSDIPGESLESNISLLLETTEEGEMEEISKDEGGYLPTILVVEDDGDLRDYIGVEFNKSFTIIEAENGSEGLKKAYKYVPDLIISDISMPVLGGLEMSEKLKKDERTSHIPIILLTAHGSYEHQKKGFEIGVEDFIMKPFSSDILEIRINNLLQSRKDLQERFSKEFKVEPSGLPVSSMDQAFLNKAMNVIEENLNNPQFSAILFAEEMCMSRVHLYRKLKALTNESVSGFVKIVRLKLAAELIRDKKMRIKEAAYTVGYSDPKYFSKCFKQQFGVNPSEYIEGKIGEDT